MRTFPPPLANPRTHQDDQDHHEDQDEYEDPTTRTIRPTDTEVMVPWYSLLLVFTAVDILIQLKVFLGRFDARTLQPANHHSWGGKRKKQLPLDDEREESAELSGCVFDYSTKRGSQPEGSSEEEIWFDWMADCGEGFNSSYQVRTNEIRALIPQMAGYRSLTGEMSGSQRIANE